MRSKIPALMDTSLRAIPGGVAVLPLLAYQRVAAPVLIRDAGASDIGVGSPSHIAHGGMRVASDEIEGLDSSEVVVAEFGDELALSLVSS